MSLRLRLLVCHQCHKRWAPSQAYKASFQLRTKGNNASNHRQRCHLCGLNGAPFRTGDICLQIVPFQSNLNKLCLQRRAYVSHLSNCFASQNSQAKSCCRPNAELACFRVFPIFNSYVSSQKHNRSNTRIYGICYSIRH